MLQLLAKAIFGNAQSAKDDPWAPIIEAAIEKAVDGTDPRLRVLWGYKDKLREPVTRAAHFSHELGERLAAPVELGRKTFTTDPRPHSFFSSVERMQEVFSTSLELRSFLDETGHRSLKRIYAALGMQLSERSVLAPMLKGDRIQQEMQRTQVSFDEHRVVLPAEDEARLRRQFKERAFTTLVECALNRMARRDEQKQDLQKRSGLLRAKLRALRSGHCGLDALTQTRAPTTTDTATLERALREAEQGLLDAATSGDVLEHNLDDLCTTLARPEEFIQLSEVSRQLTPMGYLAEDDDGESSALVEFTQVEILGRAASCGVLVSYPVDELKSIDFYSDQMRSALGVSRSRTP